MCKESVTNSNENTVPGILMLTLSMIKNRKIFCFSDKNNAKAIVLCNHSKGQNKNDMLISMIEVTLLAVLPARRCLVIERKSNHLFLVHSRETLLAWLSIIKLKTWLLACPSCVRAATRSVGYCPMDQIRNFWWSNLIKARTFPVSYFINSFFLILMIVSIVNYSILFFFTK